MEERLFIESIGKDMLLSFFFLKRSKMGRSLLFYKRGEENLSLEQSLFHVVSGSGMDFLVAAVSEKRSLSNGLAGSGSRSSAGSTSSGARGSRLYAV